MLAGKPPDDIPFRIAAAHVAFSKIESGKMELEQAPFDLSHCIEDALDLFALQADTGLDESIPASRRHAELAAFDYIETFYDPVRRHSSLGQISPVAFENQQKLNDIKTA